MKRIRTLGVWCWVLGAGCWVLGAPCLVLGASAQAPPKRIISLIPAVTEMLFAIGAGEQVVGVSSFDTYPPEAATRTKVGGLFDPDFERILSLRPDLVVVYGSQDELMNRLTRTGVAVFRYRHAGLADVTETIRTLGERTGHPEPAARLAAQIESELGEIRRASAGKPRPRTLLVFGREEGVLRGIFASGGVGFLHDMLEAAGGTNVMADVKREGLQVSMEQLLSRAPDVVIELRGSEGWTPDRLRRETEAWQGASIPAARNQRVHFIADDSLSIPGPRVAAATRTLARILAIAR